MLAFTVAGCWGSTDSPPPVVPVMTMAARLPKFEHLIALDWDATAARARGARRSEVAVLTSQCEAGDDASCDGALDRGAAGVPLERTLARCDAGDVVMCDRGGVFAYFDARGVTHCDLGDLCDRSALASECARGIVVSCVELARQGDVAARARALALARPACRDGRIEACNSLLSTPLAPFVTAEERARAASLSCQLDGRWCASAIAEYVDAGDSNEARYYAEVSCQLFLDCKLTLYAYRHLGVPPPYVGRITELELVVCDKPGCSTTTGFFGDMIPALTRSVRGVRR